MYLRTGLFIIACWFFAGCAVLLPVMVGGGGTVANYYHNEKSREVCRVSMEKAYATAIRSMVSFGLIITGIEAGNYRYTFFAKDPEYDSRRITIDLESMGAGKYVKATFRVTDHEFLPDRAYSQMVMKEFVDRLEVSDNAKRPKYLTRVGGKEDVAL